MLKKGMVVRQRDLDQAFLRMRVAVSDSSGESVELELQAPGRTYGSDRMVFGLSIGPLALTSALAATREIVESLVSEEARSVGVIGVMDDFTYAGKKSAVEEYDAAMLEAWALTGFEATKTWDWNAAEPTKWLGHGWKWAFGMRCKKFGPTMVNSLCPRNLQRCCAAPSRVCGIAQFPRTLRMPAAGTKFSIAP
jgi:hypothetical protein